MGDCWKCEHAIWEYINLWEPTLDFVITGCDLGKDEYDDAVPQGEGCDEYVKDTP